VHRHRAVTLVALVALAGLVACGDDPCAGAPAVTPLGAPPAPPAADPWQTAEPSASGWDPARLDEAAAYSASISGQCLLVYEDGKLLYERYANGASATTRQKSWSIAKSVTSTLFGIALGRGDLACVEQPVARLVPTWRKERYEDIRVRDLLSHTSGLAFDEIDDSVFTIVSGDQTGDALRSEIAAAPGTQFAYSQKAVQVLGPVLEAATGEDVEAYARRYLFDPLGAGAGLSWDRAPEGKVTTYAGLRVTCRELLRLGVLYLDEGRWNGGVLVPREYVQTATHPSQEINRAVGYLWWLNGQTPAIAAPQQTLPGWLLPELPADLYAATGLGQSFIDVIPGTRTVVVHMRPAPQELPGANGMTTIAELQRDGRQEDHRAVTQRVLAARR
jgi:CubicO group peptidase (beta-lactamase class C family)